MSELFIEYTFQNDLALSPVLFLSIHDWSSWKQRFKTLLLLHCFTEAHWPSHQLCMCSKSPIKCMLYSLLRLLISLIMCMLYSLLSLNNTKLQSKYLKLFIYYSGGILRYRQGYLGGLALTSAYSLRKETRRLITKLQSDGRHFQP